MVRDLPAQRLESQCIEMNRWILAGRDWRTLFIRSAMINACLFLLGIVVAAEFYFTASRGPLRISWIQAAQLVLRNWLPWLVLSPAAVRLADLFRFERKTWPRSLLAHLVGCIVAVFVYEGLLVLAFPQRPPGFIRGPVAAPSPESPLGAGGGPANSPERRCPAVCPPSYA